MYSKMKTNKSMNNYSKLKQVMNDCDAIMIGAGSGLSTAAGLNYSGPVFEDTFSDFIDKYHFTDMHTAGFYPFDSLEEYWAYWSRHIYLNRYKEHDLKVYKDLLELVQDKDYFVLTTNVDHCFQRAGFDKQCLFYSQGDYGLFQCSKPCQQITYDNKEQVTKMIEYQSHMKILTDMIPYCPICGAPMTTNLRIDSTFVEDEGWHKASNRYYDFIRRHQDMKIVYLELGVGENTPGIIKYPFWQMTYQNKNAIYVCINPNTYCPAQIENQSILISDNIKTVLEAIK
ncbi:MAG: Sir2 silent information regulator family NAD-dependent deacetylase [Erysipelotrichaceae bacterium]|nr:Sir2 silent information regulator family NAD-dependent deacetylase [Erysipelotrichaceae bacterium]